MRPFVKNSRDASESLLTSSIPNLQLYDMLLVYPHHVVAELYTDCHIMLVAKFILNQSR